MYASSMSICGDCRKEVQEDWNNCPFCGSSLNSNSKRISMQGSASNTMINTQKSITKSSYDRFGSSNTNSENSLTDVKRLMALLVVGAIIAYFFAYSNVDSGENVIDFVSKNDDENLELDSDNDGIPNHIDSDDDNDGYSDEDETYNCQDSLSNPLDLNSIPLDYDEDFECDFLDTDDDNDGVNDIEDYFPFDSTESEDNDEDGIGNNADLDDDNDGFEDTIDVNDFEDTSLLFQFSSVRPIEQMDYFDDYTELYFCMDINQISYGCVGDPWSISTGDEYSFDHEILIDLSDDISIHEISISMWDQDFSSDDLMDINPNAELDSYIYTYDSSDLSFNTLQISTSGEGDGNGWDGALVFSITSIDLIDFGKKTFEWNFNQELYNFNWNLDYSIYTQFKQLDHSVSSNSDYARFSTPHESYVENLSSKLNDMAYDAGYDSDLERAQFILSFVQSIPYQYDLNANSEHTEYPKYPIEMLWENSGDCEDAAALYISLMESLGYDATLVLVDIKSSNGEDDDWIGHAVPAIYIPNHSGESYSWTEGEKSNLQYFIAEATASGWLIGEKPWDDEQNVYMYDIE